MSFDPHLNLRSTTVAVAPSPASSGTSLTLDDGSIFPATSLGAYNLLVWPVGVEPTRTNSEIIRVTTRTGNVLNPITRQQEGSNARSITVGDQVALVATAKTFEDIEALSVPNCYVVNGNPYALTGAGVRAALAAAAAAGGGKVVIPPDTDIACDTTTILVPDNCALVGEDVNTSRFLLPNSGSTAIGIGTTGGAAGTTYSLTANMARGAGALSISAPNLTSLGVVAGDIVQVEDTNNNSQMFEVESASGTTVTLRSTAKYDFTTANTSTVRKMTMINVTIGNFTIDGNGNSSINSIGFQPAYVKYSNFLPIKLSNMNSAVAGANPLYGFHNVWQQIEATNCAAASQASLWMSYQTDSLFIKPTVHKTLAFGLDFYFSTGNTIIDPISNKAAGRGLKLEKCHANKIYGGRSELAGDNLNNLMLSFDSSYNDFFGFEGLSSVGGSYGVQIGSGDGNRFYGCRFKGNSVDIGISSGAVGTEFWGCEYDTINDVGTGTLFVDIKTATISRYKANYVGLQNDASLNDDADLTFYMPANSVWEVKYVLYLQADSTTPNIRTDISVPAGFVLGRRYYSGFDFGVAALAPALYNDVTTAHVTDYGTSAVMVIEVVLQNGATAGLATLRWAQGTSHADFIYLLGGSNLVAKRLA